MANEIFYQKEPTDSQTDRPNLHAFENCPFHGHIQIIFNSNMAKCATV